MNTLISWAGEPSHQIAVILRERLPTIIPSVNPWVSSEDISKGSRWGFELAKQLADTSSGLIVCVPNNINEPWLNYEAGALSKSVEHSRVWTLLFGLTPDQISDPLKQFQATVFEKEDVRKLMRGINEAAEAFAISVEQLHKNFEIVWPGLSAAIQPILAELSKVSAEGLRGIGKSTIVPTLSAPELKILMCLAAAKEQDYVSAERLAGVIQVPLQKAKYYLDQLKETQYIGDILLMGSPPRYYLSKQGRAFLVKEGLL